MSLRNPRKVPLTEARYFVYKLKEKSYFVDSIMRFNEKSGKNWLDERNIAVLGGYLQLLPHFETSSKSGQEGDNELFEAKAFNPR